MIGIIIAMEEEFLIENNLTNEIKKSIINNQIFYEYKDKIVFTYSGIGKVNAAISSYNLIINYKIKNLINIGTSGAIINKLKINDLLVIEKFFSYDVNLVCFGYKIGQMPKEKNNYFKFKSDFNKNIYNELIKNDFNLIKGNIASGDTFIDENNFNNFSIFKYEKIDCVDMESWSIAFVCSKLKINLLSIKIISDLTFKDVKNNQFKNNLEKNRIKIEKIIKLIINII